VTVSGVAVTQNATSSQTVGIPAAVTSTTMLERMSEVHRGPGRARRVEGGVGDRHVRQRLKTTDFESEMPIVDELSRIHAAVA
jgi:hypothetical protein